jgi:Bacterial membrane protein YfhO
LTHRVWVPSLYLGASTVILALAAAGFRGGPPWRAWLTGIAAVGLIGSFGEFASPILIARYAPKLATDLHLTELARRSRPLVEPLGPNDTRETNATRLDGFMRDGDGSPYYLMAELLPGFQQFRFPSKLLTFVALAVAGLAGLGWDGATLGKLPSRKAIRLAWFGSGATLAVLIGVLVERGSIIERFAASKHLTLFGPLDPAATTNDIQNALIHGVLGMAAVGGLLILARRRVDLAGVLALLVLSVDLGLANSVFIKTAPQAEFDKVPKIVELIAQAERLDPSPGPYRVHRMPVWGPVSWQRVASDDRVRDFVRWESDTIQPKYGLLHGVEYTQTVGVAELYDHSWFFSPFPREARADAARMLGVALGYPVVVYPRRGFDLWNTRYFILPALPDWKSADRGYASFLPQTRQVYPAREILTGKTDNPVVKEWLEQEDFQIVRNLDAFPRAWIIHDVRFKDEIAGLNRRERRETMEEILFSDDPFWHDTKRTFYDPRRMAWIEVDDRDKLRGYVAKVPSQVGDSVKVVVEESGPQRTVLDATLAMPGLVILGDVFYPGWNLTIDGQPAPIYRANRLMRGAAVKAGKHRLVYTYEPRSFQVGAAISLIGIVALVASTAWTFRRGGT